MPSSVVWGKRSHNSSASERSHLPNSKIMAQISRALSTSLRFDPNKFTKGMTDKNQSGLWIVSSCSSTQRTYCTHRKEGRREKRGGGQGLKRELSAVYSESHKFLQRVALVPQIPPDWLNGSFQSCPDQWGSRDRGPSMWNHNACLLSCCWRCVSRMSPTL